MGNGGNSLSELLSLKIFCSFTGGKNSFSPQKTQRHCLAENAATVRNLHLGTCLFPVVLYFEWMPFFTPYENNIGQKKITWKNLILWGFNSGLSSGLLVSDSICFSPVMFMCHPVIKLSFLLHIVKQEEPFHLHPGRWLYTQNCGGRRPNSEKGRGWEHILRICDPCPWWGTAPSHVCMLVWTSAHVQTPSLGRGHTHTYAHTFFLVDTQLHFNCSGSSTMGPRRERGTLRDGKKVWERSI